MQIINIVPAQTQVHFGKMAMLLTHLVESDSKYAQRAAEATNTYKILDNSLIELHEAVTMERLLTAADNVRADEIILPDVFCDGEATCASIENSLSYLRKYGLIGKYRIMAVCQGHDFLDFVQSFELISHMKEVDVIGIPKVCATLHPAGRPAFEFLWRYCPKTIHLLGIWYSWSELRSYLRPELIRSVDTSLAAFQCYYHMNPWDVRPDKFTIDLSRVAIDEVDFQRYHERLVQYFENTGMNK